MYTNKRITPKPLSIRLNEQQQDHHGTNMMIKGCNRVGESSFRVLYYGASTGSVPFMWESQPGTPKHSLTQSSLPPLTPPPSYQSMQMINNTSNNHSSKRSSSNSGFLRNMFKKRNKTSSFSNSCSVSSSSSSSSWSMSLSMHMQSTPMSKTEVRRMMKFGLVDDGGHTGSPTSTLCIGGGVKQGVCRFMKA
ncbi:aspartate aminotransferase isoform 1 [Tanacetum coccineum]